MLMRRILCLFLQSAVLSSFLFIMQGMPDHLSGVVVSENGTPVVGVKIFGRHDATTDAAGRFDIPIQPEKDRLIYFHKEGFRPTTVVIKPGSATLTVVLEDDSKTAWVISACALSKAEASSDGRALQFILPSGAQVRKLEDIDYREDLVTLSQGTRALQLWWGPFVSPGQTVADLILQSAKFEERTIRRKSGEAIGYDRWGRSSEGMAWRSADFPGLSGTAIYEGVLKETATSYDRIIDTACYLDMRGKS
jgi:hypothetical protein